MKKNRQIRTRLRRTLVGVGEIARVLREGQEGSREGPREQQREHEGVTRGRLELYVREMSRAHGFDGGAVRQNERLRENARGIHSS